jgi:hypothetical protein
VFPVARLSLHKGNNPWHTLYEYKRLLTSRALKITSWVPKFHFKSSKLYKPDS